MRIIVGVDPGTQGGIAWISEDRTTIGVAKLSKKSLVDIERIFWNVSFSDKPIGYMEKVNSFPGEGVRAAHSFGKSVGRLEMGMVANAIPINYVMPQVWQRKMALGKVSGKRKHAHQAKAIKLFPAIHSEKKITLEICDALLIAEYGWRTEFMK